MTKNISIVGIVIGILLILNGLGIDQPDISINNPHQYVTGEAYNYIIESSLRGGIIAGTAISKALYIVGGSIISVFSVFKFIDEIEKEKTLKAKEKEKYTD